MLYAQLLKADFERLPRALRRFHAAPGGGRASGKISVRHASGLLARLAGFPPEGDDIPLQLEVAASENQEVWTRRFGDTVFKSVQRAEGGLLLESFGAARVHFRVSADETGMRFVSERARWWLIPIPLRVQAAARGNETSWEIEVSVAGVGSYRGDLVPVL